MRAVVSVGAFLGDVVCLAGKWASPFYHWVDFEDCYIYTFLVSVILYLKFMALTAS